MDTVGFDRKVMAPVTLSDGTVLPQGAMISMPAGPMARDPEYYEQPDEFKADRFLRDGPDTGESEGSSHELSGIEPGNLHWGSGRFTCPGRWYASCMMKMTLATILVAYEVKFPDGQTTRPPTQYIDDTCMPNQKQEVLIRSRASRVRL
jgi:cytochrome P450